MTEPGGPTLAAKLNTLFTSIRPDAERQYTNKEVAAAVGCTPVMIGYLRSGQRDNPSINLLRGLEEFFGVPCGYLYVDDDPGLARRVDDQLAVLDRMVATGVMGIAQRASLVSAEGLAAVTKMLDAVIELERARGERDE